MSGGAKKSVPAASTRTAKILVERAFQKKKSDNRIHKCWHEGKYYCNRPYCKESPPKPRKIVSAPFWFDGSDELWTKLAGWYTDDNDDLDPYGESRNMTTSESLAHAREYVKNNPTDPSSFSIEAVDKFAEAALEHSRKHAQKQKKAFRRIPKLDCKTCYGTGYTEEVDPFYGMRFKCSCRYRPIKVKKPPRY